VCNQVIYGKITGDFVDSDGNAVQIKDQPIISYFKRSGFKPVSDYIDTLNKQKKVMQKSIANFSTSKNKKGSVTYWVPVVTPVKVTDIKDEDKELMRMFGDTVKAHNETITNQYREAVKLMATDDESDLASDFVDVHAT